MKHDHKGEKLLKTGFRKKNLEEKQNKLICTIAVTE